MVDLEPLRKLYVDDGRPAGEVAARLGLTETDLAHHGIAVRRPGRPAESADQ